MRRRSGMACAGVAIVLLVSCKQQGSFQTDNYTWPGDRAVYERIENDALARRDELRAGDRRAEDHRGYAAFAVERMETIGCHQER